MPVEIRELIIKTEIAVNGRNRQDEDRVKDFNKLRKQLMEECKRLVAVTAKRNNIKR